MKKLSTLIFLAFVAGGMFAQVITTTGLSFTPDSLIVHVGDQVTFNCDFAMHPLQEVSAATWSANGSAALSGGFSATSGNTLTVPMTQAGTRYYVCTVHVQAGMKGRIFVTAPSGIEALAATVAATYPNPATRQIHVITGKETDLQYILTDMMGRAVINGTGHVGPMGYLTLDVSAIADGEYVLQSVSTEGSSSVSRVQVLH